MASISSIPKNNLHVRSVSLPSRSTQISEFDDLEATTSSSSVGQEINGLKYLYNSSDNFLKEVKNNEVNEFLDELLRLLDLCSTAKDALSMTRDSTQELQSVLRRKRGGSIEISCAIQEYQSKRKTVKKAIIKAMRHLKGYSHKKIQESPLRNIESVTLRVLESFFGFILGSSSHKKTNKWSVISKILSPKLVAESLVGKVDGELAKKFTCLQVENVQTDLAQMELSLEDVQEGLECIFRHLIKTRVSLLNLLNC